MSLSELQPLRGHFFLLTTGEGEMPRCGLMPGGADWGWDRLAPVGFARLTGPAQACAGRGGHIMSSAASGPRRS